MSSAISIVKPGESGSSPAKAPTSARLAAANAAPFVPKATTPTPTATATATATARQTQPSGHQFEIHDSHSHSLSQAFFGAQEGRPGLDRHLYHPPSTAGPNALQPTFFLAPSVHQHLTAHNDALHQIPAQAEIDAVGGYSGLVALEKAPSAFGAYASVAYKGWNSRGLCFLLRRIVGFRVAHESTLSVVDKWTRVRHPSLVSFHEAFTTRDFGDHSLVFVYDLHPLATTAYAAHLSPLAVGPPNAWSSPYHPPAHPSQRRLNPSQSQNQGPDGPGLVERVLWSYIVQLASAIKAVHHSGLAVRNVDPSRVLVTAKNRVRLSGCAVLDVINFDSQAVQIHQQDDLLGLGKLIIALGCGSSSSVQNLPHSVDHISRAYSAELKNVVLYLLSKPGPRKSIDELISLVGARVLDEFNSSLVAEDVLERELVREVENGRLVRLLAKFGFINERPEFDHDPRWAESGDRYIIKLFRDWVFHQVDDAGRPVTDLAHVLTALNKLDAGVDEKLLLVSRDEQSCLIVTYREVKNCIEAAFGDLSR